ncbi:hypothetical protein PAXINDRAFT_8549 [Paxillus involutus ATCC 200175]|jgi:hypothetical protein|nr:hypothetical protein PAXINDRAFT_8549 [Paxillus involutus ATCC 200175]
MSTHSQQLTALCLGPYHRSGFCRISVVDVSHVDGILNLEEFFPDITNLKSRKINVEYTDLSFDFSFVFDLDDFTRDNHGCNYLVIKTTEAGVMENVSEDDIVPIALAMEM